MQNTEEKQPSIWANHNEGEDLNSKSHLRSLFVDNSELPNLKSISFIGLQGHKVSQKEVNLVKTRNDTRLVYMKKDIREGDV